jgi:hypothetical protein
MHPGCCKNGHALSGDGITVSRLKVGSEVRPCVTEDESRRHDAVEKGCYTNQRDPKDVWRHWRTGCRASKGVNTIEEDIVMGLRFDRRFLFSAITVLLSLSIPGVATEITFFGEDINHTASPGLEDAIRIAHPNSDAASAAFLSHLNGVATETFESFPGGSSVSTLTFGLDTAILSPALTVLNLPTDTYSGVYPISGNQTLLQAWGTPQKRIPYRIQHAAGGIWILRNRH